MSDLRIETDTSIKCCSFTGHRSIRADHASRLPELLQRAIAYAYDHGCREFASGGAVGFDTIAAREVLRFRISHPDVRLVMILPCVDQDLKWTPSQCAAYRYILSSATEVIYVSDKYTPSCIRERNFRLAERADILIAYMSHRDSGAGQTVAMATRLGKKTYNLYSALEREKNGV